jgi:hypothetical protein
MSSPTAPTATATSTSTPHGRQNVQDQNPGSTVVDHGPVIGALFRLAGGGPCRLDEATTPSSSSKQSIMPRIHGGSDNAKQSDENDGSANAHNLSSPYWYCTVRDGKAIKKNKKATRQIPQCLLLDAKTVPDRQDASCELVALIGHQGNDVRIPITPGDLLGALQIQRSVCGSIIRTKGNRRLGK